MVRFRDRATARDAAATGRGASLSSILSRGSGFIRPDCQPTIGPPSNAPDLYTLLGRPTPVSNGRNTGIDRARVARFLSAGLNRRDPRGSSKQLYADYAPSRQAPLFAKRKEVPLSLSRPAPI